MQHRNTDADLPVRQMKMRLLLIIPLTLLLAGCETTSYQRGGVQFAPPVKNAVLGKWGRKISEVHELAQFRRGTTEFIAASVTVAHNIPNHWENEWRGNILLRRIKTKSDWQMASEHLAIPKPRDLFYASEEELSRLFDPATIKESNQSAHGTR